MLSSTPRVEPCRRPTDGDPRGDRGATSTALAPLLRGYADFYESNPSDEGLEAMARDVIAAPEDEAFLLVATDDDDEVVGFALNQWKWSSLRGARVVVMDDLFVAETARGAGHADALIEAVADGRPPPRRRRSSAGSRCPTTSAPTPSTTAIGGTAETLLEYELEL